MLHSSQRNSATVSTIHYRTTHTITQSFYCSSGFCPGLAGWAGTRKAKPGRIKPIWIYWRKREWVAVASAGPYASLHLIPDNHANIPPLSFLQAGCPSCRPTNSVKALKAVTTEQQTAYIHSALHVHHSTRSVRLSYTNLFSTPFVHTSFGKCSLSFTVPTVCNSVHPALWVCTSLNP